MSWLLRRLFGRLPIGWLQLTHNRTRFAAAIAGVVWGVALYGLYTFRLQPDGIITLHYIHFMVITLVTSVTAALAVNRFVLGGRAVFAPRTALAGSQERAA